MLPKFGAELQFECERRNSTERECSDLSDPVPVPVQYHCRTSGSPFRINRDVTNAFERRGVLPLHDHGVALRIARTDSIPAWPDDTLSLFIESSPPSRRSCAPCLLTLFSKLIFRHFRSSSSFLFCFTLTGMTQSTQMNLCALYVRDSNVG